MDLDNLKPCPFCGSQIKHITSMAKSFDPPRVYHEWRHVEDDNECVIRRRGMIIASASDDPEMQATVVGWWNRRAS